jgi:hypothetical protein
MFDKGKARGRVRQVSDRDEGRYVRKGNKVTGHGGLHDDE